MFKTLNQIPAPEDFKREIPVPRHLKKVKAERDRELADIFTGKSDKFILIIGPCSADDTKAVCDYVQRISKVQEQIKDKIFIVPRIYTNKPRTTGLGYKGMLHQPNPKAATDIKKGIEEIRKMHIKAMEESHLTAADEMLYPENFMFLDDLLSYHAVGARSVENQQHRLTSSGVDAPVGMKNPTSGDLMVMFNSITAAQAGHVFMYRQDEVETFGNPLAHAIMRGSVNKHGENIPNYHYEDLLRAKKIYDESNLQNPAVIVDLNHSNSGKIPKEQIRISREILLNRKNNPELKSLIKGLMIESYIVEGSQKIDGGVYGKSITDPCLGFEDSKALIFDIYEEL